MMAAGGATWIKRGATVKGSRVVAQGELQALAVEVGTDPLVLREALRAGKGVVSVTAFRSMTGGTPFVSGGKGPVIGIAKAPRYAAKLTSATTAFEPTGSPQVRSMMQSVVGAVASVHRVGGHRALPVVYDPARTPYGASYDTDGKANPKQITLGNSPNPAHALAHEMGHALDHRMFGKPGSFASTDVGDNPVMDRLMETIEASATTRELLRLQNYQTVELGNGQLHTINKKLLAYILQPHELFANAYAQYIATRSDNTALAMDVQALRGEFYRRVWSPDEFAPIAAAFDALFTEAGAR